MIDLAKLKDVAEEVFGAGCSLSISVKPWAVNFSITTYFPYSTGRNQGSQTHSKVYSSSVNWEDLDQQSAEDAVRGAE